MFPSAPLADRLAVDLNGMQQLRAGARSGDPEALRAAAQQFEALFVQTMLKTMRQTRFSDEGDPFADSASLRLYQELLDQQWAQKMVAGRGLGFAEVIVRRMGQDAAAAAESAASPGSAPPVPPARGVAGVPVVTGLAGRPAVVEGAGEEVAGEEVAGEEAMPAAAPATGRQQRFIEALLPHAQAAERATGVPARFVLAHAALESGWGAREIPTGDGGSSHNLFGIKAGPSWGGGATETLTTEYRDGLPIKTSERFRAYADYGEAFADYAGLLRRRYREAVAAGTDAEAFVAGLVKGGYATDPAYATKLLGVIASIPSAVQA